VRSRTLDLENTMSFDSLGLAEPILRAVRETGYTTPTPIQSKAIPPVLEGRDVLGCAQTGTGKTAAFTLPILNRLADGTTNDPRRPIRCLVLSPTRELAAQIGESVRTYGKHTRMRHTVIFGGVGQGAQVSALRRGIDVLVATPGRLLDLLGQGLLRLDRIEVLVLDEADRMLDMGFINDIRKILRVIPAQRQTLFFSATMPREIRTLADEMLHDPVAIEVAPVSSSAETVDQRICFVEKAFKVDLLKHILADESIYRCLVFTRTKHGADKVADVLSRHNIKTEAIHGNKSQNQRQRALESFRRGHSRVLVASDIAARGLDIDEIDLVINFDVPNEPETYVHRIGRTGRAGTSGKAISFCSGDERAFLRDIEKLIRRAVPVIEDHPYIGRAAPPRPAGTGGGRPSPGGGQRGGQRGQGGQRSGGGGGFRGRDGQSGRSGGSRGPRPARRDGGAPRSGGEGNGSEGSSERSAPSSRPAERPHSDAAPRRSNRPRW
jgi:ATP-dependent RNA helicase RhlE